MASVSARLRRRVLGSMPPTDPDALTVLADLPRGCVARVVGVDEDSGPTVARRLFDLGFAPGAEVMMVRRAPMSDPAIYSVAGYEVALRRAQARCIQVEPVR